MKPVVYIDGKEGTTGLQIYDRIGARDDIQLLLIDEAKRKDPAERAKLMNQADIVFLCLPDAAAREAVSLVTNPNTRIIDASTAHRVNPAGTTALQNYPPGTGPISRSPTGWQTLAATPPALSPSCTRWWPTGSCRRTPC